jgi:hypothetical protein
MEGHERPDASEWFAEELAILGTDGEQNQGNRSRMKVENNFENNLERPADVPQRFFNRQADDEV